MTIENLQVFEILVQELNFTRAARRANMSQTTLSRKISAIEDELQVQLFKRDRHSVQLTNAGREFYVRITPILQEYRLSVMQAQNVQRGVVVIPKSTHVERIRENFDIWDFELTAEEMEAISSHDMGYSGTRAKHFEPSFVRMCLGKK